MHKSHWKYKGRLVAAGNNIRDEWGQLALFEQTASSPASSAATRLLMALSLQPGYCCTAADAVMAYIQAPASNEFTWLRLPKELWLEEWGHFSDPVVPMKKSLYGHAQSGRSWEIHLGQMLRGLKWKEVEGWNYLASC